MDQSGSLWVWAFVAAAVYAPLCGGFGAYVAEQKGRPGLEGFLFGLFLGPIGVVAAACLPDVATTELEENAAKQARVIDEKVEGDEDDKIRAALAQMESKLRRVVERDRRLPGAPEVLGGSASQQPRLPDSWTAP